MGEIIIDLGVASQIERCADRSNLVSYTGVMVPRCSSITQAFLTATLPADALSHPSPDVGTVLIHYVHRDSWCQSG